MDEVIFFGACRLFPPHDAARSPSGFPLKFRASFSRIQLDLNPISNFQVLLILSSKIGAHNRCNPSRSPRKISVLYNAISSSLECSTCRQQQLRNIYPSQLKLW